MASERFKKKLIEERGRVCQECRLTEWRGKPIPLEVHHVEGDGDDTNVQLLCPNCHALTPNYRGKAIKGVNKVADDVFIAAAQEATNISDLLVKIGLVPKGANYTTARNRLAKLGLSDKFKKSSTVRVCPECGIEFVRNQKFCSEVCANRYNRNGALSPRKVERPNKEILCKMVEVMGYSGVGRIFGVSDNSVRKWTRSIECGNQ